MLKRSSRQTDFPLVKFADINFVEIFPPIGVARLGDSAQEYFLDPELPIDNDTRGNILPTADNKFRDGEGNIRRQVSPSAVSNCLMFDSLLLRRHASAFTHTTRTTRSLAKSTYTTDTL